MNNTKFLLLVLIFLFPILSYSQDKIIEINNTSISQPQPHDFGEISERAYVKYIIKNNRNVLVKVSDITTPAGYFANISDKNIASGKKVILYVGLDPSFIEKKGAFNQKIIIKTNLVKSIDINLKGTIK